MGCEMKRERKVDTEKGRSAFPWVKYQNGGNGVRMEGRESENRSVRRQ